MTYPYYPVNSYTNVDVRVTLTNCKERQIKMSIHETYETGKKQLKQNQKKSEGNAIF